MLNRRHWLSRSPKRCAGYVLGVVLFNGLAMGALRLAPGMGPWQSPGGTFFFIGGLLMVSLLEALLEQERTVLQHWVSTPGWLGWMLASKALFAWALGTAGALPVVVYVASRPAGLRSALPALSYGVACVGLLAFCHAALWLRSLDPRTRPTGRQRLRRVVHLVLIAAALQSGFTALARPAALAASSALAVVLVCALWHSLPRSTSAASAPGSPRPAQLTALYALGTLIVLQFLRGFTGAIALRRGSSPAMAMAVAFLAGGVGVLGLSLFWLRLRGVPALRQQLGLHSGKGLRVILREALLWSMPSVLFNQAYWAVVNRRVAGPLLPAAEPPATMTALSNSPWAVVTVGVIAAPLLEELLFRGMFHRALRTRWSLLPSLLLSTTLFLTDHTLAAALPVLVGSICITLALERSGSLYAAVLVHTIHNGVLALQMLHARG